MQFADNADPDQPALESMYIVVYIDEQRIFRSIFTDAHAHLDLRYSHLA